MSVEGVIFDVSDTLLTGTKAVAGVVTAIDRLRAQGIQIIAVHNDGPRGAVIQQLTDAGINIDHVVTRAEVGKPKGSPLWINHILQETGLQRNQLLYVGDSDYDMFTASHGKVVYFHATWARPHGNYGIPAPAPGWVTAVVTHIFRKQHRWAWYFEHASTIGPRYRQMALIDGNGAGDQALKNDLITLLKNESDPYVGRMRLSDFVVLHLIASLYAQQLFDEVDTWTTYPSRDGTRNNRLAQSFDIAAKLFRDQYHPDVFVRHTPALHSRDAFYQGGGIPGAINNQLRTVTLNPARHAQIANKTLLVLDDFLTRGVTTGVARMLLLNGGANDVVTVAVGKYGSETHLIAPPVNYQWDGAAQPSFASTSVRYIKRTTSLNQLALDEFAASHRAMKTERW